MSNPYIGIDNSARLVKQISIGQSGVARKVLNGYVGVNGVARLFYQVRIPLEYSYTGRSSARDITIDGVEYTVLTLTSSGTLTFNRSIDTDIWMCGGGGNGGEGTRFDNSGTGVSNSAGGGGGGYIATAPMQLTGNITCVIGAARGTSEFGEATAAGGTTPSNQNGGAGASGGGGGIHYRSNNSVYTAGIGGQGSGGSTIPAMFGLTDRHCAGGAGGVLIWDGFRWSGVGGSNGSDGAPGDITQRNGRPREILGGERGGGMGRGSANANWSNINGTFYGSGGGGGSCSYYSSEASQRSGGTGYQGVVYIRWKKEDAE